MSLEMSAFIDYKKMRESLTDIQGSLERAPDCCIYRVPRSLRKINAAAYIPQLISIGPHHYGKEGLADMEKQKSRYMSSFLEQITTEKWENIFNFIRVKEQQIRNFYAERSKLESSQFVTMILYDAIFIIELFRRNCDDVISKTDYLLAKPAINTDLHLDLLLLENQLPYCVLNELYRLAFDSSTFMDICLKFFKKSMFEIDELPQQEILHFTDLLRTVLLRKSDPAEQTEEESSDVPCAMTEQVSVDVPCAVTKEESADVPCAIKLRESGVKFLCNPDKKCFLDIEFKKQDRNISCFKLFNLRIPFFKVPELQIPQLEVEDQTESILRNIMALEQCHYPSDTRVCHYVDLMDHLINTGKDVDLLVEKGIITNSLGDNAAVASMINKLGSQIFLSKSCRYYGLCKDLREHHGKSWNNTKATLKSVYFSNLWRGTATFAAVVLLLLTVIQTICSIMQVV